MLQPHGRFKLSKRTAAPQHQVTQPGRFLPGWGVILMLALITLACGLSPTASGPHVKRVVILNRLPTLTPTPVDIAASGQRIDAPDAAVASQPLPPTATATPSVDVPLNASGAAEPTHLPVDLPTPVPSSPSGAADDWLWTNVQLYPNQAEGLLLFGELMNNSGASQTLTEISGTFYDAQGQLIADAANTIGYWPVDIIPPDSRVPIELVVEGIQSAANFNLNVMAEPGGTVPRQDFEFGELHQRTEADSYCLTGQFQNFGTELQNYLVIGATLYDARNNIVNFGDYYQPDLAALTADQPLAFEICIGPPNQGATRYELWAWGE